MFDLDPKDLFQFAFQQFSVLLENFPGYQNFILACSKRKFSSFISFYSSKFRFLNLKEQVFFGIIVYSEPSINFSFFVIFSPREPKCYI